MDNISNPSSIISSTSDLEPASNPLALISIIPPPHNQLSNFSQPTRNDEPVIRVGGLLLALASIFVANRIYFKYLVQRRRTWDDLTLLLGYIGGITFYAACLWGVKDGSWGRHLWDVSILSATSRGFLVPAFLYITLYPPTLTLIRTSFFIMYLEIFGLMRGLKIASWAGMVVTVVFGCVMTVLSYVCAAPFPHEGWLEQKFTQRADIIVRFSFPQSVIYLVLDLYVLILPIWGVSKLQMSLKRKLGVILIFMSAIFAVLGSILTMVYRKRLNINSDYSWNLMPVLTVTLLEIFVGIIVACMPAAAHTLRMTSPHFERLSVRIRKSRYWSYLGSSWSRLRSSRRSYRNKRSDNSSPSEFSEKQRFANQLAGGACTNCGHCSSKTLAVASSQGSSKGSEKVSGQRSGEGKGKRYRNHMNVCESFVGVEVTIPNATFVRSCLRSTDRLNGADLERGDEFYLSRDWRREKQQLRS